MPDREKVIKGLECCMVGDGHSPKCELCPYTTIGDDTCDSMGALFGDALALLKAQEPVKPWVGKDGWYRCSGCNNSLASGEKVAHFYGHPWPKYCEECGRAVKWE